MIRRFYVHNFRCLENFELPIDGKNALLLIGKNGSGKSTVAAALEVLQKIARGTNRVASLVNPKDLSRGRNEAPMRFELKVEIKKVVYEYVIAFELPEGFKEMRVLDEKFVVNGKPVYTREFAQVALAGNTRGQVEEAAFRIDWHMAALPIVQEQSKSDPLFIFKEWLSRVLILRPIPSLITGESNEETLQLDPRSLNFGAWFAGILAFAPAAYSRIEEYLKQVMPDFHDIRNPVTGKGSRGLEVSFSTDREQVTIPFEDLSDGEKSFIICALVLAANNAYGPLVCFWDEPDSFLALDEVGHFVIALRKAFQSGGQFVTTSHSPEAIRRFSSENTLLLHRRTHLDPTVIHPLEGLEINGNLVDALIRGDVEP